MRKSSKPSENALSFEVERQVKDIIFRALKFKAKADSILSQYRLPVPRKVRIEDPCKQIETIFLRFHNVVKQLSQRHENRSTLQVNDEYDVQDLLHSLLKLYFEDIRTEEWTPSYAGGSTRMDFLLKKEQIVIEVKKTRYGLTEKKLGEELIIDKAHYRKHPDCKILYCFVYDPDGKLSNPRGLERDLSEKIGDFETKVFVIPRV
jgi:hypothetical protein